MAREMTFRGKTIIVRQLTVGEVADFFDHVQGLEMTTADLIMDRQVPAVVVATACGLTLSELGGDVLPSDLAALWDAVEGENPFFCATLARVADIAKRRVRHRVGMPGLEALTAMADERAMTSERPPASSPETATAPA